MIFTAAEKQECAEREVKMRKRVYARWIAAGSMDPTKAATEIAMMESIAADYAKLAEGERLI